MKLEKITPNKQNKDRDYTLREDVAKEIEDAMNEPCQEFSDLAELFIYLGLR